MAEEFHNNWLELCKAASETKNADEFLKIVRELHEVLEREEWMSDDSDKAVGASKSIKESQC